MVNRNLERLQVTLISIIGMFIPWGIGVSVFGIRVVKILLVLVCAIQVMKSSFVLRQRDLRIHLLLSLLVAWSFISVTWSVNEEMTVAWSQSLAFAILMAIMLISSVKTVNHWECVGLGYLMGCIIAAGKLTHLFLTTPYIPRMSLEEINPNNLSYGVIQGMPIAWTIFISRPKGRAMIPLVAVAAIFVSSVAVLAITGTRSALLAFVLSLAGVVCYSARSAKRMLVAYIVLIPLVLFTGYRYVPEYSLARVGYSVRHYAEAMESSGRDIAWSSAWDYFVDHPLQGIGAGAFPSTNSEGIYPHNMAMGMLSQTGLVGLCLYLLAVVALLSPGLKPSARSATRWGTGNFVIAWLALLSFGVWEDSWATWYGLAWYAVLSRLRPSDEFQWGGAGVSEISKFPRVLVVSSVPFCRENATGITMSNLFRSWPSERVGLVYVDGNPDHEICSCTHRVGEFRWYPLAHMAKMFASKRLRHLSREVPGSVAPEKERRIAGLGKLHRLVRLVNEYSPVLPSMRLGRFIGEFKPDVIYSTLGSLKNVVFVTKLAKKHNLPVVPHFFDDWPLYFYSDGYLRGIPQKSMHASMEKLMQHVPVGLCIGEDMADEYRARYGKVFYPLMNCVEDSSINRVSAEGGRGKLTLTYIGGLHLNRWKSLLDIARSAGEEWMMKIFCPQADIVKFAEAFAACPNVTMGSLASDAVFQEMKQSDLLLHVESFDEDTAAYSRLSVSTKIPQYMAAGKPILAYGPKELASIKVIKRSKSGVVMDGSGSVGLGETLRILSTALEYRARLAQSGVEYARSHFSGSVAAESLRRVLGSAARRH